VGCKLSSQN